MSWFFFQRSRRVPPLFRRYLSYEQKYQDKIRRLAEERGVAVSELMAKVKQEQRQENKPPIAPSPSGAGRKDSSPVKPLSSLLNLTRITATPHTSEQISALWTVFHESRSNGTGRGYVCASIPLGLYSKMAAKAAKYPMFVVPLKRGEKEEAAHEFYLLQWSFHDPPPPPLQDDLFSPPTRSQPSTPTVPVSTVMFTPLQEYKSRTTFATPYLVLTNYTDLAESHNTVLLHGELTPSAAVPGAPAADERYLLPQNDALRLTTSVQNFYLDASPDREKLLKAFHETPAEFDWTELLKHAI
ncbi:hypothetical protein MIND_00444600 [Mycena indigotica]|uniref:ATP11-domain-containing protein n=1 Tax=Mycena indigotica TaxID=2126181 RepID=A0A8H6SWF4_9AGAR|nr:uncharacterized protein MIND_00444600 [Mycena indigotica]KAF7306533.1 hypothetical protein MIND_00444600 [Mycena indigotica]